MTSDLVGQAVSLLNTTFDNVTQVLVLRRDDTVNPDILVEETAQSHWIRLTTDSTLIGEYFWYSFS